MKSVRIFVAVLPLFALCMGGSASAAEGEPPRTPGDVAKAPADAEVTSSGLKSRVMKRGGGKRRPSATSKVEVHYSGWTTDGRLFDSSRSRGKPATFPLTGVIKGWTEGLQLMVVGERRRFWIPADLAYGDEPKHGRPAGLLVFDIELLSIVGEDDQPPEVVAVAREPWFVVPVGASDADGPATAEVTIVEFSEFQCPFCSRANPTLRKIRQEYGDRVRVVFKHNPLPFHKHADGAALAALAAGKQGKFWEMHDLLFSNQRQLGPDKLEQYAAQLGLDVKRLKLDMKSPELRKRIDDDKALAAKLGARGTPTFFINGRKLMGAQPFGNFKDVIDAELIETAKLLKSGVAKTALYEARIKGGQDKPPPPAPRVPRPGRPDPAAVYKIGIGGMAARGPADALVTIVELSDFQCPFCNRVQPTLTALADKYGDDLRIVFRHNPLPFHKDARPAAKASIAANAQGKFWEMHDKLFGNQRSLKPDDLERYAMEIGLNMASFKKALADTEAESTIATDQKDAAALGANGTPSFFINGRFLSGAQPQGRFETVIDVEMARAKALVASGTPRSKVYAKAVEAGIASIKKIAPSPSPAGGTDVELERKDISVGDAHVKGPADAPVTIIEFVSFQCPFCARSRATMAEVADKYPGKVRFALKHNPLPFHKDSALAAEAAEAAGEQGKFWEMHDKLFDNRKAMGREDLDRFAKELGLDVAKFSKALDSHKFRAKVNAHKAEAAKLGANGTPAFFINGVNLRGAQAFARFKTIIDAELAAPKDGKKR